MNEILEIEKVLSENVEMTAREKFNLRIGAVVNEFFKDCDMQEIVVKETIVATDPPQNKTLYGKLLVSLENTEEIES